MPRRRSAPCRSAPLLAAFIILLCAASHVTAQTIVTLEHENDLFAFRDPDLDRWYTSGIKVSWSTDRDPAPAWLQWLGRAAPWFDPQPSSAWGWSLQQRMFTPEQIAQPRMPPDDRPYAGWLNLQFSMANFEPRVAERFSVGIGIVGPASLAEQTQKLIHRVTGAHIPVGWETQLGHEPTLLASYERQWKVGASRPRSEGARSDWRVRMSGTVSNAATQFETGLIWRGGVNLPQDFGPASIAALPSPAGYFRPVAEHGWYVTFGANARLSAYDLFLDGTAFRSSPAVSREPFVAEVFAGWLYYWRDLRVSYLFVRRSVEFRNQGSMQDFGSITVSWTY